MVEHEFYADPTVFDLWQDRAGGWFSVWADRASPYAWCIGFFTVAITFILVALAVFFTALLNHMGGDTPLYWNQSLAQSLTVCMALIAANYSLRQALRVWPEYVALPKRLQMLNCLCGRDDKAAADCSVSSQPAAVVPVAQIQVDAQAIQVFFAGVRAAGVNVAIAKALFDAGIRCDRHLCNASDEQLLDIRGVGPATVRKLRACFS